MITAVDTPPKKIRLEPRPRARAVLYVLGLVLLAVEFRLTGSLKLQLATVAGLFFLGYPLAAAVAGQPVDPRFARLTWNRCAPPGVLVAVLVPILVWGGLGVVITNALDLGTGFGLWFIAMGHDQIHRVVLRRQVDRGALLSWKPVNPVRQCFLIGLAIAPAIAVAFLVGGKPLGVALGAGLFAGAVAAVCGAAVAALSRARPD